MNKFYTLTTDTFVPISHDNKHLFNTYELVNNFIRTRISNKYRNILAKPILQNYVVNWFSPYQGLQETVDIQAQRQYFAFRDELEQHIGQLLQSNDPNNKNWAGLLQKVFSQEDNKLFSNGKDISYGGGSLTTTRYNALQYKRKASHYWSPNQNLKHYQSLK